MFGYRWPIVESLPFVQLQNAGRYELFLVFFLALLAGLAVKPLARLASCRPTTALALGLLIVTVDLLPTTFRQPYHFTTPQTMARVSDGLYGRLYGQANRLIRSDAFPPERLIHVEPPRNGILVANTRTPTIACVYVEHTRAADQFLRPLIPLVRRVVLQHAHHLNAWLATDPAQTLLDALYLTGTRYHLTPITQNETHRGTVELTLSDYSPIVLATELRPTPPLPVGDETALLELVERMKIDRTTHTAEYIPTVAIETTLPGSDESLTLDLRENTVYLDRVI